ncbi:MAG: hypothetical protein KGS72_27305 [Cyanobacteria bacterium REEB67]|nr:hypothetical protein [Cyanobacteria bacterium REEB67]
MSKKIPLAIAIVTVSVAFLAAWVYSQPAHNSGWLLFVAIVAALSSVNYVRDNLICAFVTSALAASFGLVWFTHQGTADIGWTLFAAIVSGLGLINSLAGLAKGQSVRPPEED